MVCWRQTRPVGVEALTNSSDPSTPSPTFCPAYMGGRPARQGSAGRLMVAPQGSGATATVMLCGARLRKLSTYWRCPACDANTP